METAFASQRPAYRHEPEAGVVSGAHSHFLYNALHAIDTLVRLQRADEASRALGQLADIHGRLTMHGRRGFVTLAEEIALAELYLEFERIRFGDGLSVSIDVSSEARPHAVPRLLLLPVVENAVKHGIAGRMGLGRVALYAGRQEGQLILEVRNDPPLRDRRIMPGLGYGLRSTRERLASLYGTSADLTFTVDESGDVVTRIRLPV